MKAALLLGLAIQSVNNKVEKFKITAQRTSIGPEGHVFGEFCIVFPPRRMFRGYFGAPVGISKAAAWCLEFSDAN